MHGDWRRSEGAGSVSLAPSYRCPRSIRLSSTQDPTLLMFKLLLETKKCHRVRVSRGNKICVVPRRATVDIDRVFAFGVHRQGSEMLWDASASTCMNYSQGPPLYSAKPLPDNALLPENAVFLARLACNHPITSEPLCRCYSVASTGVTIQHQPMQALGTSQCACLEYHDWNTR